MTDLKTVRLSALSIAALSAVLTGGTLTRSKNTEIARARFLKLAAERAIAEPETFLAMDFEEAKRKLMLAKNVAGVGKEPKPGDVVADQNAAMADVRAGMVKLPAVAPREPIVQPVSKRTSANVAQIKAKAPKTPASLGEPASGKRAAVKKAAEDAANRGQLPAAPDFSANTHKPYRAKLAKLIELAQAGDIKGLKGVAINLTSTSPKALAKYRDLAVMALEAKAKAGRKAA